MTVSTTAGRLAAVALAATALTGAVMPSASAAPQHPRSSSEVRISDVRSDVRAHGVRSNHALNKEWVELTNSGRREVNLRGWTLSDAHGHTYTFRHYHLRGRASVRVHTGFGRDTATDVYQDRRSGVWDSRFDSATLRNDRGRLVDSISWGSRGYRGHR
ncbi:lamin tail domain-containing protein [Streptomyces nodosus]|uniref:lamin tail domain-containing protein n=1 Tax=Streptomyces nodosus TaxID=40318 RepID=UPI0036EF911A